MPSHRRLAALTFYSVSALFLGFTGCSSNEPGQRQRDERQGEELASHAFPFLQTQGTIRAIIQTS